MKRRLLSISAAVCLLLCAAVAALWVRSAWVYDMRTIDTAGGVTHQVGSSEGFVVVQRIAPPDGEVRWQRPALRWGVLGVQYVDGRLNRRRPWGLLMLPYWVPIAPLLIPPAWWLLERSRRERRQRWADAGLCGRCGGEIDAAGAMCSRCGKSAAVRV